jgi:hypothetical protein
MNTLEMSLQTWFLELGDFTVWAWIITVAYGVALLATIFCLRKIKTSGNKELHLLWVGIAFILALLGINKQLDFQTLLIILGRAIALSTGWIDERRMVQKAFTVFFSFCIGGGALFVLYALRRVLVRAWLEIVGIAVLLGFTIIRAASIGHSNKSAQVENMLKHIHALELAGILIVLFALYRQVRKVSL